jgi:hypothetical protein
MKPHAAVMLACAALHPAANGAQRGHVAAPGGGRRVHRAWAGGTLAVQGHVFHQWGSRRHGWPCAPRGGRQPSRAIRTAGGAVPCTLWRAAAAAACQRTCSAAYFVRASGTAAGGAVPFASRCAACALMSSTWVKNLAAGEAHPCTAGHSSPSCLHSSPSRLHSSPSRLHSSPTCLHASTRLSASAFPGPLSPHVSTCPAREREFLNPKP